MYPSILFSIWHNIFEKERGVHLSKYDILFSPLSYSIFSVDSPNIRPNHVDFCDRL